MPAIRPRWTRASPSAAILVLNAPERAFDSAVVFLPKSKDLTDYILNALASRLAGRELYLVGEKKSGIEGAAKQLNPFGKPRKLDSARHCQLWLVTVANAPEAKPLESLAQTYELPLAEGPLKVISLPGVFSHGRLDRGSALLLEHLDKLPSGHLLDFGCGAGRVGRGGETSLSAQPGHLAGCRCLCRRQQSPDPGGQWSGSRRHYR